MSRAANAGPRRAGADTGTAERILAGTLVASSRRGLNKVSMSDIGDCAGVSRGTLYRYFSSKDEVVTALPDFVQLRWERELRAAVAERPEPGDRLRVVMDTITGYAEIVPETVRLIRREPGFGMTMLERNLPHSVRVLAKVLEPVIEEAAVVHHRVVTGPELAEIILGIAISGFLVPPTRKKQLDRQVTRVWDFLTIAGGAAEGTEPGHQPIQ